MVRARVESDLGFRIAGKIVQRLVDPGQVVRRGQPLMRLDPTDLALGASAQTADVASLHARASAADADLQRLDGLVAAGAVSAQTYDQAKAAAQGAHAQLAAAQAQSSIAANALGYAQLTADSDGVVEEVSGQPGEAVAAGQAVVKLAQAGPREAEVSLPETVRPALGSPASASLYGDGGLRVPAHLRQRSQAADPATRTFAARYVLEGAAAAPLGSTVTLTLPAGSGAGGVKAPLGAIYDAGTGPGVWVLDGDYVRFRRVRLLALGAEAATLDGVEAGKRIVALGADRLREGERVRATPLSGSDSETP